MYTHHQDLFCHSNVHWLSLRKLFQQVWKFKEKIISFLELLEKVANFPERSDTDWLCDLSFPVDILAHMNERNVKLQGKDHLVQRIYTNVSLQNHASFILKTVKKVLGSFPHTGYIERGFSMCRQKYKKSLQDLYGEFCQIIYQSLQMVASGGPFRWSLHTIYSWSRLVSNV